MADRIIGCRFQWLRRVVTEMDNFDYKLGKLNGILTGLSYVNNKANHGYTFEIIKIDASKPLEIATETYLKGFYKDATVSFSEVIDWRSEINAALHTWLFSYLLPTTQGGCGSAFASLKDVDNTFSMSIKSFRDEFIKQMSDQLDALVEVKRVLAVSLITDEWYEMEWVDFAIEGKKGVVFIHLGVSD